MTFVVKSKPGCTFCEQAISLLKDAGEAIYEEKHETDMDLIAFRQAGFKTFPQVFHNGKLIGGYTDLKDYLLAIEEF